MGCDGSEIDRLLEDAVNGGTVPWRGGRWPAGPPMSNAGSPPPDRMQWRRPRYPRPCVGQTKPICAVRALVVGGLVGHSQFRFWAAPNRAPGTASPLPSQS